MKFLADTSDDKLNGLVSLHSDYFLGQLQTPLTGYKTWDGIFAIDNGAFSKFEKVKFASLLAKNAEKAKNCLFVVCPDIVCDARRTLELWAYRNQFIPKEYAYKLAFVAQDGQENLSIPWDELDCLFLGGGDPWKDSKQAQSIVKTALMLGKHTHIGRVNTASRFKLYADLGADTCDGSGIIRFSEAMLPKFLIEMGERKPNLFEQEMDK
jgi:hypothetical protein